MQIFDDKKRRVGILTGFKDRSITKTLNSGDMELSFEYPVNGELVHLLKEEYYIRTKTDEFVIKAIEAGQQYNKYTASLNVEELEGQSFPYGFASQEQTIRACLVFAFEGTGWTVGTCTVTKRRTIDIEEATTAWDVLQSCLSTYRCECIIDSINKRINIYEQIGNDRGCYFMEGLNLRKLTANSDTYEFYTRIVPIGKDGITIEWLTGRDYLENYQYSTKIKTYTWKDERYTDTTSLMEDAEAKLEEMSKPYKVYAADVVDLARANPEYTNILDYGIGDTVKMVSRHPRIQEKQRIVKIVEYPETPEKNTVELSNTTKTFAEVQRTETEIAKLDAVSIANSTTKKILTGYYTKSETETRIVSSKEEIELEVKRVEESTMHNYIKNGSFSSGFDDWYNTDETNNEVVTVTALGTVAKILKTSSSSSYIRQRLDDLPAGKYRVRYKAATAAGYEGTARVQCSSLGSTATTNAGVLKSTGFTTIERDITISAGTKYIYFYAYVLGSPVYIKDIEVLGLYSSFADARFQVTADEITSEVNKKVNSADFGTLITQNAYNVRIAFNKNSDYIQFDYYGITLYRGEVTDNEKRTRFDYNGEHFYRDGYYIGKIGTNNMKDNASQKGLVFDLENAAAYMSWSWKKTQDAGEYTMKWSYCTQQCGNYEADMLHAGADIDMHWFKIKNVTWEDGGITATINFVQVLEVDSDGNILRWGSNGMMQFKNGILIDLTYYTQ